MAILSHKEAKSFYDRFGPKQDSQAFYEDPATDDLISHAAFNTAQSVFEFGCGTGRFAEKLLAEHLPESASYMGVDVSTTMVEFAKQRLGRFGDRVAVYRVDGEPGVEAPDATFDRFVSNYVLDLLAEKDIRAVVSEAHRSLLPHGLICFSGLSGGTTLLSRLFASTFMMVHRISPKLLGGCRPVEILDFVREPDWRIVYRHVVTPYCIPSEVVVAKKLLKQDGRNSIREES